MLLKKESREFIELLNSSGVDFLIVGAVAVAWHGHPRFTGDLDILVRPTQANAEGVVGVLRQFGFSQLGITPDDMAHPDRIIQLGDPPNRINLITSITGVPFDEAWAGKVQGDLIRNKEATGRGKDLGDAMVLRKRRAKP